MKIQVIIYPEQYRHTWRIYCPVWGDTIAHGFESEEAAHEAASTFGFKVIKADELKDTVHVEFGGHNYTMLKWFIDNTPFGAISKGYASLRLYEARIQQYKRDGNEMTVSLYEGLSVGISTTLENLANDLNGHYFPSYQWTNLARWENEQAKLAGIERITTAEGTCELI